MSLVSHVVIKYTHPLDEEEDEPCDHAGVTYDRTYPVAEDGHFEHYDQRCSLCLKVSYMLHATPVPTEDG